MVTKVSRVSETSFIIYFGDVIDLNLIPTIASFTRLLKNTYADKIVDVTPSYTSVLIEYHPLKTDVEELIIWSQNQVHSMMKGGKDSSAVAKILTFPVYYHPDVAPDLEPLARQKNLSIEQVIAIHSQVEYTVCAIGFAPGFAFLGSVDSRIATARHAEPRLSVVKGSVGIADTQTAIYPQQTPGGWQIIGNCPIELFNINQDPMMPFEVGDKIRFEPITREQFLQLGGSL